MSDLTIGILVLVLMVVLIFLEVPLAFTFAIPGILGIMLILGPEMGLTYLRTIPYTSAATYTYCIMPLFMLMGDFCFAGGLTTDAYSSARKWFGHMPGGLAITSTVASGIFGAVCGSGTATAMVMTQIAWPEMKRYGYQPKLALGSIAAAGPIAILIPPSVPLIMFGMLSNASIGQLLMAGWIPGIMLTLALSITTVIMVKRKPALAPQLEKASLKERFISLRHIWSLLILIVLIMGGIWGGLCTVNEAAGVGAVGALIIALARRKLTPRNFWQTLCNVAASGGSLFFMFVGIAILNVCMTLTGVPRALANLVVSLPLPNLAVVWIIVAVYLFLGCFLDSPPIMMLTTGLIAPCISAMGYSLIWFGVVATMTVAIGALTPPVGINLFCVSSRAPGVPTSEIIKGVMPYIVTTFIVMTIIIFVPQLATWLPDMMRSMG